MLSQCLQGGMAVPGGVILDLLQTGSLLRSLEHAGYFLGLERERWPAGRALGGGASWPASAGQELG